MKKLDLIRVFLILITSPIWLPIVIGLEIFLGIMGSLLFIFLLCVGDEDHSPFVQIFINIFTFIFYGRKWDSGRIKFGLEDAAEGFLVIVGLIPVYFIIPMFKSFTKKGLSYEKNC
jgi:hypothetical protein